jgi:hypothetical protein
MIHRQSVYPKTKLKLVSVPTQCMMCWYLILVVSELEDYLLVQVRI